MDLVESGWVLLKLFASSLIFRIAVCSKDCTFVVTMKRGWNIYLAALFVACVVCVGCVAQRSVDLDQFDTQYYSPKYASGFEILTLPDSTATLLKISKPWQGALGAEQELLMLGEGVAAPEGFKGALLRAPAQRIITLSSSNIAMIEAVGLSERIVGGSLVLMPQHAPPELTNRLTVLGIHNQHLHCQTQPDFQIPFETGHLVAIFARLSRCQRKSPNH